MKIHVHTNNTHYIVIDVICDSCGQSCKTEKGYEFISLRGAWSDEKLTAHVCRKCIAGKLHFINFKKETWENPFTNKT